MDENKQPDRPFDDQWLEEFLAAPELGSEIQADEQAIAGAGLTHPNDLELEKIMQEVLNEVRAEEDALAHTAIIDPMQPSSLQSEPETFKDDEFRAAFGEGDSLNQVFSDQPMPVAEPQPEPAPVEENEEDEEPVEKSRPKRKKGSGLLGLPHLAATAIWLMIIIAIGVSIGRLVWLCASDVLAFGREPITASITIAEGDDIPTIAKKLKDAGLIEYTGLFEFYADITDAQDKIKPGTYQFKAVTEDNETIVYDYMALVTVMSPRGSSLVVVDDLRIPEGYTCAQIFQLLEEKGVCTVKEMEAYVASLSLPEGEE